MDIAEHFKEFLHEHFVDDICNTTSTELEKTFMDSGMSENEAADKADPFYTAMIHNEEAAYIKGVKDGAQLQLHLLDKAPENKKEVSQ
jgi:heat shock protein HspQ